MKVFDITFCFLKWNISDLLYLLSCYVLYLLSCYVSICFLPEMSERKIWKYSFRVEIFLNILRAKNTRLHVSLVAPPPIPVFLGVWPPPLSNSWIHPWTILSFLKFYSGFQFRTQKVNKFTFYFYTSTWFRYIQAYRRPRGGLEGGVEPECRGRGKIDIFVFKSIMDIN